MKFFGLLTIEKWRECMQNAVILMTIITCNLYAINMHIELLQINYHSNAYNKLEILSKGMHVFQLLSFFGMNVFFLLIDFFHVILKHGNSHSLVSSKEKKHQAL